MLRFEVVLRPESGAYCIPCGKDGQLRIWAIAEGMGFWTP
jgi:hypothetical protein